MDNRDARHEGRLGLAVDAALFVAPAAIALIAVIVALALSGCAASQSPSLSTISPHLVERAEYGTCAETGGKLEVPQAGTVALLTSVCWMRADAGSPQPDAAPEPVVIVPEKGDAGASE